MNDAVIKRCKEKIEACKILVLRPGELCHIARALKEILSGLTKGARQAADGAWKLWLGTACHATTDEVHVQSVSCTEHGQEVRQRSGVGGKRRVTRNVFAKNHDPEFIGKVARADSRQSPSEDGGSVIDNELSNLIYQVIDNVMEKLSG